MWNLWIYRAHCTKKRARVKPNVAPVTKPSKPRGWDTGTQPTGGQAREVSCSRDVPREMLHTCGTGGLSSKMALLRTELQ